MLTESLEVEVLDEGCDCTEEVCGCCLTGTQLRSTK